MEAEGKSTKRENSDSACAFLSRLRGVLQERLERAAQEFDRAFQIDPSLLQAAVGKPCSYAIAHQDAKALTVLRATESKIDQRGVSDPKAIYKIAEAYAVLRKNLQPADVGEKYRKGLFPLSVLGERPADE